MTKQGSIRIERDALTFELDRDQGSLLAARKDGAVSLGPLLCRASYRSAGNKAYDPASTLAKGWKAEPTEIATPAGDGPGFRAVLDDAPGLPAALNWEVALIGGDDACARLTLVNRDAHPIRVHGLCPLTYRGADPGLDLGAGYGSWRFYRTGFQSWSPSGSIKVLDEDYKPRFFLPSRAGVNPRTPYSRRSGEKVSDWMAQVVEPELGRSVLMGFVTSARLNGRVEFEIKYDRFRRLEAVCDGEGVVVGPGESLSSEWLLLSLSVDPLAQQARYFDAWARAMKARPSRPQTGWCTWYFAFWKVTENAVNKNLAALADWKGMLDFIQVDDGFERWVGDWTTWNDKFPTPPATLAGRVKDAGFKPGVWLAPFLVSQESPLYRQHPDWIIHNRRGRPVTVFIHPAWKGHLIYALDATHPGVQKWLAVTVKMLASDFGFEYLKLDFLYAASAPGVRYDKQSTGAMALRRGLEIIREAAGENVYILGCGCPLGPAVGLVDAMRVSQDVDVRWKLPVMDAVSGVPTGPGARNCFKNNLARALMHGRLWANDPDCVVLRNAKGGMKQHEFQTELTLMYLSGGALFLSEDVTTLPPERLEWFKRMIPPSNRAAIPLDLMEKDFPEILFLAGKDSALVALFNWSEKIKDLVLDPSTLGLEGSWHVFDYWAEKYLGIAHTPLALGPVPPHGHKYLRLVRADSTPRLLATNLHMGMGEMGFEMHQEAWGVRARIILPGERRGKVWAAWPGAKILVQNIQMSGASEISFSLQP